MIYNQNEHMHAESFPITPAVQSLRNDLGPRRHHSVDSLPSQLFCSRGRGASVQVSLRFSRMIVECREGYPTPKWHEHRTISYIFARHEIIALAKSVQSHAIVRPPSGRGGPSSGLEQQA